MTAQAIHAIDQGLAECRESKQYWQGVLESEPRWRRLYLTVAIWNGVTVAWQNGSPIWLDIASILAGSYMLWLYLRSPRRVARAKYQIEMWQGLERQWLGFYYAVQEEIPYEEGDQYGP